MCGAACERCSMCRAHPSVAAAGPDAFCELSYRRAAAGDLLNVRFEHNTRQHATIESWEHGIARFLEERGADAAFVRAARGRQPCDLRSCLRAQLRRAICPRASGTACSPRLWYVRAKLDPCRAVCIYAEMSSQQTDLSRVKIKGADSRTIDLLFVPDDQIARMEVTRPKPSMELLFDNTAHTSELCV